MSIRCGQRFHHQIASSSLWQQHIISSTSFTIANDKHDKFISRYQCLSSIKRFISGSSQRPIKVALPKFGQNGTLILRNDSSNNINISNVQIIPQWRDDAMIELLPSEDCSSTADAENDDRASGVDDEEKEIATAFAFEDTSKDSSTTTQETYGPMQFTNHTEGIVTSLGRKGSLVEVDILDTNASLHNNNISSSSNNNNKQEMKLIATIPEKSNLTCQLNNSGDIEINGKLEGDTHLSTNGGNITVSKLRGHHVSLETTSGIVHVKKAIEAKSVHITTYNRVRAQMLNGSNVTINVKRPLPSSSKTSSDDAKKTTTFEKSCECSFTKLDEDDEGALIDVGSLYISSSASDSSNNEAQLLVEDHDSRRGNNEGLVRVKSCHGHVTVHATQKTGRTKEDDQQLTHQNQSSPLVDIGGVNGSCDIKLEVSSSDDTANTTNNNNNNDNNNSQTLATGTRVHFDAMTPDSISTITSRGSGNHSTSITMDRKLEAEVRMLSVAKSTLPIEFDAYSLTSDDTEDVQSTLKGVSDAVSQQQHQPPDDNSSQQAISIETDAYQGNNDQQMTHEGIEYKHGTMSNRSGEPDSRFDVRTQSSSSHGKINIDGAASQALNSFKKKSSSSGDEMAESSSSDTNVPLLAVATDGTIKLETLSWFGSIARRYGMDEEKNDRSVGRQASRKPRLG